MARRRRSTALFGVMGGSLIALVSCELLVSGDLPPFQCTGIDSDSCPSGLVCDEIRGTCVPSGSPIELPDGRPLPQDDRTAPKPISAIGEPCARTSDCQPGLLCGTTTLLTAGIIRDGIALCTKTCCTSKDCDDGFVCYAPATCGNYCVKAGLADRTIGTKGAGEDCSVQEDCRSGVCEDDRCKDTCCGYANECGGDTTCRYNRAKDFKGPIVAGIQYQHHAWACLGYATIDLDSGPNQGCGEGYHCASFVCVNGHPGTAVQRCTPTCCSTQDCRAMGFPSPACAYLKNDLDYIKECLDTPDGGAPDQTQCSSDFQCASLFCDPSTQHCASVCCRKSDCKPDEDCLPAPSGQPLLRCVKAN